MSPGDWSDLRRIRLAALADAPQAFSSTLERETAFDEAMWRSRTARTALAWQDQTAVGMVSWITPVGGSTAQLVALWVTGEARGTGASTALVRWVVEQAVGDDGPGLDLLVLPDNARAIALYQRLGFVPIGREPGVRNDVLIRMRYRPSPE